MSRKKICIIIIVLAIVAITAAVIAETYPTHQSAITVYQSGTTVVLNSANNASIDIPVLSSTASSSCTLSDTETIADITQNNSDYSVPQSSLTKPPIVHTETERPAQTLSSEAPGTVSDSITQIPDIPISEETVTKTIGNNTMRLNVNAFTLEAFVDWSSVQEYLFDDFYVKVYKNGALKKGPTLYGCVTKDLTNTVAVEIDTYESNDRWYIEPAMYKIECYSRLGEYSLVKNDRPEIIPCPSATFTVTIDERGFQ